MLYCWGCGPSGQLGLGRKGVSEPGVPFRRGLDVAAAPGREVTRVACGERHTLFLHAGGGVSSCGDNTRGQLGRRARSPPPGKEDGCCVAEQVGGDLKSLAVSWVSCGKSHSLAVSSNGKVFSWGAGDLGQLGTGELEDSFIPRNIAGLSTHKIIQIACGHYHSVALAKDGRVFSWGLNKHGQLGTGKDGNEVQPVPQLLSSLHGIPLAQVAAGGSHSFALSVSGVVYGWGRNSRHQLGLNVSKPIEQIFKPHSIGALRNLGVTYVSCGDEHSAVLTKHGSVHTFGDNSVGQLGHSSSTSKSHPQKIDGIDVPVSHLACGSYHTVVFISDSGQLISFGRGRLHTNETGMTNGKEDQAQTLDTSPLLVADGKELMEMQVKQIYAGAFANFATVQNIQVSSAEIKTTSADSLPKINQMDSSLMDSWLLSTKNNKMRDKFKRAIEDVFSSPSGLAAHFLNPLSSVGTDGCFPVDLQKAEETFKKLANKEWIADTISSILQKRLIPDLPQDTPHREALYSFLLLPVCSAALEAQNRKSLAIPFAIAVKTLSQRSLDLLEKDWSMLPPLSFAQIIQMLNKALLSQLNYCYPNYPQCQDMIPLLEVLKKLFKVNRKANYKVHISSFYLNELNPTVDLVAFDFERWLKWISDHDPDSDKNCAVSLCRFPFVYNLQIKKLLLALQMVLQQIIFPFVSLTWKVRRHHLVEDTLRRLSVVEESCLKNQLAIIFEDELKTPKTGHVLSEFFSCLFNKMVQPSYGMFMYCEENSLIWFPVRPRTEKKKYFLFGMLCGLSLYNGATAYIPFPLAAFKKLLGKRPTLDDLKELDPDLGKSLQELLDSERDDIEEYFGFYYSINWDEEDYDLIPNGISTAVDKENRKDYVTKYVDYIFNKSVEEVFGEFKRGFYKVLHEQSVQFCEPEELMAVAIGTANYDWDLYEKNALYQEEYSPTHPTIKRFWKAFHELDLEEKKSFLHFVSGSDRVPGPGMGSLRITIRPPTVDSEDNIPESLICHHTLLLPSYSTKSKLKMKLLQAVENKFGIYR